MTSIGCTQDGRLHNAMTEAYNCKDSEETVCHIYPCSNFRSLSENNCQRYHFVFKCLYLMLYYYTGALLRVHKFDIGLEAKSFKCQSVWRKIELVTQRCTLQ